MNTTLEDKNVKNAKLKLERILFKADEMGFISKYDGKDYPEYIHDLWNSIIHQPILMTEALAVESKLGNGDTIQLVSDAMFESFHRHLESY
ncbi:hypothetical protein [Flavimarina sp. Hel_I_48]|uniref:hypothetical protein n=1 Tax=Flavimarina sp. Hel_I_48 TaxID=1392488 RepID=UPI0004DF237B|nr:hypothetical protein [Flavimarina sp. Hel_I_48]